MTMSIRKVICRHCKRPEPRRDCGRGLCWRCHTNLSIRCCYDGPRSATCKNWTAKEREELRRMRSAIPKVPIAICAVRLNRSYLSVMEACKHFGYRTYARDREGKVAAFKKWYKSRKRNRTDDEIASIVGCHRNTIRAIRVSLGIPRGPYRNSRGAFMRCDACPARVPTCRSVMDGWAVRKHTHETASCSFTEVYCPKCFARWGWPELPLCHA